MWNGFWRYRYLLWNLVSRDFKLKYRRSVLGVVWSVLNPLLMCLVYWAVFSSLMDMRGSGIDNFAVFLMCGQLLFNFFNEATSTSMSSVLSAAPLLKKVYIPKYIFPLEKCCFAMVNCVFSFVALTFSIGGFNMQQIIKLNPMYWYITGFRRTVMWGISLDFNMFAVCGICALISMWLGVSVFRKTQDRFVLHI